MHPKVTWAAEAEHVLTQVALYLGEHYTEEYALKYLNRVRVVTSELADHPTKGRRVSTDPKTRRWKLNSHHYLVYEITHDGINIVSMLSYKLGQ